MNKFIFALALVCSVSAFASPASESFNEKYEAFMKEKDIEKRVKLLDQAKEILPTYEVQDWATANHRIISMHMMVANGLRIAACNGNAVGCSNTADRITFIRVRENYRAAMNQAEHGIELAKAAGDDWKKDDFLRAYDAAKSQYDKYSILRIFD